MTTNIWLLILALAVGLAALTAFLQKAALALLMDQPIKIEIDNYRVVFSQRGWSFVGASIERLHRIGFVEIWRTIYIQEGRFGDMPWGYSMRRLGELSADERKHLANEFLRDFLMLAKPRVAHELGWQR